MAERPVSRSQIELLKNLDSRVNTAARHFDADAARTDGRHSPVSLHSRSAGKSPALTEFVPHAERVTFNGLSCVRIETRAELTGARTPQGHTCPAMGSAQAHFLREHLMATTQLIDRESNPVAPDKIAFLDTETTSLAGGTGTVAFLVGVGRFRFSDPAPTFSATQYFIEDYSQEEALIHALTEELSTSEALATYNGRCFDIPILESRWRLHRSRSNFPLRHFDLLYPARRLWRRRLPDCRLGTIERRLLKVVRYSDVESAAVPRIFNDYVRSVGPHRILGVLDHHAQDIFSLGALFCLLSRGLANPCLPEFAHAADQWGLAQIFRQACDEENALACLERACVLARDETFGFQLAMHLGRRLMRLGRHQEALDIFKARAMENRSDRIEAHVELAKWHEHKRKNIREARRWTEAALALLPPVPDTPLRKDLQKRLDRLNQRDAGDEV